MMIDAIIVDDVYKAIILLKGLLEEHCPDVHVVATAENVQTALTLIERYKPQLIFLDIEMAGKSGFDLLAEIKQQEFQVVLITAHAEYALKAFRFSVTDYLLKPVDAEELKQAVEKVKKFSNEDSASMQTLRIPTTNEAIFVNVSNIVRLEAEGHYTHIILDNGKKYVSSYHLKQFEDHLDSRFFKRVQRSHLINRDHIQTVTNRISLFIEMHDGKIIEVARRRKKEVIDLLGRINIR
jgi:two-component system LytT family response regulator